MLFYFILVVFLNSGYFVNSEKNCDKLGIVVYEDMGCTPNYKKHSKCPSSFNCTNLQLSNKCTFRGQTLSPGEIPNDSPVCQQRCFCQITSEGPRYGCPQFGCASWGMPPPTNGCYLLHELEQCCSSIEQYCPPFPKNHTTCIVDGKVYQENQLFIPKDSCHRCICKKGFKGKYEKPYCIRSPCGVEIRFQKQVRRACAPLYEYASNTEVGPMCCPSQFVCPDGTEQFQNTASVSKDQYCQFGNRTVKLGEYFIKDLSGSKIKCECKMPPLLTCLSKYSK